MHIDRSLFSKEAGNVFLIGWPNHAFFAHSVTSDDLFVDYFPSIFFAVLGFPIFLLEGEFGKWMVNSAPTLHFVYCHVNGRGFFGRKEDFDFGDIPVETALVIKVVVNRRCDIISQFFGLEFDKSKWCCVGKCHAERNASAKIELRFARGNFEYRDNQREQDACESPRHYIN